MLYLQVHASFSHFVKNNVLILIVLMQLSLGTIPVNFAISELIYLPNVMRFKAVGREFHVV